jgi:branched-subunit amino acid aminotransferase/4-amino-4-deoxychorismate lyase
LRKISVRRLSCARPITFEDLRTADEAMLTSTSVCLLPVIECDGRPIGAGKPGPQYRQLLKAWSESVGVDIADQAREFAGREL